MGEKMYIGGVVIVVICLWLVGVILESGLEYANWLAIIPLLNGCAMTYILLNLDKLEK